MGSGRGRQRTGGTHTAERDAQKNDGKNQRSAANSPVRSRSASHSTPNAPVARAPSHQPAAFSPTDLSEPIRVAEQSEFGRRQAGRPAPTTGRGPCAARDGRVHTVEADQKAQISLSARRLERVEGGADHSLDVEGRAVQHQRAVLDLLQRQDVVEDVRHNAA